MSKMLCWYVDEFEVAEVDKAAGRSVASKGAEGLLLTVRRSRRVRRALVGYETGKIVGEVDVVVVCCKLEEGVVDGVE